MDLRKKWVAAGRNPAVRTGLFATGCVLLAAAPAVGIIPGPGGVVVAAAGLTLMLRNSRWAKRQYVRFKRWQPKAGGWFDWGLRRSSARRREQLRKVQEAMPEASAPSPQSGPARDPSLVETTPPRRELG